jgi:hypothetical protein
MLISPCHAITPFAFTRHGWLIDAIADTPLDTLLRRFSMPLLFLLRCFHLFSAAAHAAMLPITLPLILLLLTPLMLPPLFRHYAARQPFRHR